jgi:hypothetical protein
MFIILIAVIGMVAWSLHLMQQAIEVQEFSLMLAGCLVAAAAAAMMVVYFLMGDYVVYMSQTSHLPDYMNAMSSETEVVTHF